MVNFIALSSSFIVFTSQLLLPANAHVKLYYAPNNLPIRNAASTTTDGAFSTAGACGGRDTWGPLKNAVPGVVGSVVCGRINYNGGHQPDNNNAFRAVWACDTAATKQTTQTALQAKTPMTLETGTSPAANIDATKTKVSAITGNVVTEGYTLCIKIPTQGLDSTTLLEAPERQCTLSILDQRNWGGCIDFVVSNDDGTLPAGIATQSPTAPKTTATSAASSSTLVVPKSAEGTYRSPQQCAQSGGKCCPYSYIALKGETRYASVRLLGLDASCNDMFSASKGTGARGFNYQIVLEPHKLEADALVGYLDVNIGGGTETQKLEIYVRDPTKNGITVTNISPTSPLISDFTASPFKTLSEGIGQQMVYEPTGPYGSDFLAFIIILIIVLLYIVIGMYLGKRKYGTWKHIHSDACASMCTKAGGQLGKTTTALKSAGGKTLPEGPLPPGWREAKDKEGDIYYYNKELNKTQWERPTA